MNDNKNIKKKNYKLLIGIFLGLIFSSSFTYAWYNDIANEISYDSSNDWLRSTTVQGAIDELYKQKNCPIGYSCYDKKSNLSLGDYIQYTPVNCYYSIDLTKTGGSAAEVISPCELTLWRVLSINQDGTVDAISENVSSASVTFYGLTGFKNYIGYLNLLASQYETPGITAGSRHFGYNEQTEYITDNSYFVTPAPWSCSTGMSCSPNPTDYEAYGGGDTAYQSDYNLIDSALKTRVATNNSGTQLGYYVASRYYGYNGSILHRWTVRYVSSTSGSFDYLYSYEYSSPLSASKSYSIRPIVTFDSSLNYSGLGTKNYPMEITNMPQVVSAILYYNSNANSGSTTVSSSTVSCVLSSGSCTVNIPSEITSSVGTWNNSYAGLSASTGNMTEAVASSATSITLTGNATYYSLYRNNITYIRPNATTTCFSQTLYKNQWFTSNSAMSDPVISTSTTGTNNTTFTILSGYTFKEFRTSTEAGGTAYANVTAAAKSTAGTLYLRQQKTIDTITFKYSSSDTGTVSSASTSGTDILHCSNSTTATINYATLSPSVTHTAPYGTTFAGWKGAANNVASLTTTPTTASTTWYAVYQKAVNIYAPTAESTCAKQSYYRTALIKTSSTELYTTVLSNSTTGTTNAAITLVDGYTFTHVRTGTGTSGSAYSLANAAKTTTTTFYGREHKASSSVTFKYSSSSTGAVSSASASGTNYLHCTSTSAAAILKGTISPGVTHTAPYGTTFLGWKNAVKNATSTTTSPTDASTTWYAVYQKSGVTNYYYGSSYTSRSLYRNSVIAAASDTTYTNYLNTTATAVSNYSTATGPGSSTWYGLSTAKDTTREYSGVAAAASSTATTLYTVYRFSASFLKGSNVSSIGATSGTCRVTTSSTACNVTLPTISPNAGYVSVGWNTTSGATTGTSAGSNYSISSSGTKLYANAITSYSWHYHKNLTTASGCYSNCSSECLATYNSSVWSCINSTSTAPSSASLNSGKYCWCSI